MMDDSRRCTARSKQSGERCKRPATRGTRVCRMHGGAAGQVQRAAKRRLEAQEAREAVVRLGVEAGLGKLDPKEALELELWRTHVQVLMYEQLVEQLGLDQLHGPTFHATGRPTGERKPHVIVELRDRERRHLADVALSASKAGVEERRVRIEEDRAQMVGRVFKDVFSSPELGLTPQKRTAALELAGRHLRLIAQGEDAPGPEASR